MSRRRRRRRPEDDSGLELTSLLDVIFNLVFFFIVATNIRTEERFFDLTLPKASEGKSIRQPQLFPEVAVARDGSIALNGEVIPIADLEVRLRSAMAELKVERVVLSADGEATVQQTTNAMDVIQKAGATNVIQRISPGQ